MVPWWLAAARRLRRAIMCVACGGRRLSFDRRLRIAVEDTRNQDEGNSGLGLAITRDIARSHGGDVVLGKSPMGGLRAVMRLPL